MNSESPAEDVMLIEEQVEMDTEGATSPGRRAWPGIAGLVLGSLGVAGAMTFIVRRMAAGRSRRRGRRRGALVNLQPRIGVFAPSMTIALPFSSIAGQVPPARGRGRAARPMALRRERTLMRRGRAQVPGGSAMRGRRDARQAIGR